MNNHNLYNIDYLIYYTTKTTFFNILQLVKIDQISQALRISRILLILLGGRLFLELLIGIWPWKFWPSAGLLELSLGCIWIGSHLGGGFWKGCLWAWMLYGSSASGIQLYIASCRVVPSCAKNLCYSFYIIFLLSVRTRRHRGEGLIQVDSTGGVANYMLWVADSALILYLAPFLTHMVFLLILSWPVV